jgi:hypothetical protein
MIFFPPLLLGEGAGGEVYKISIILSRYAPLTPQLPLSKGEREIRTRGKAPVFPPLFLEERGQGVSWPA